MTAPSCRFCLLLLAVLTAGAARADHLDEVLNKKAPEVVDYLRKHDLKTVGVLRFRVKQDTRAESFQVGPVNGNIVDRVENALILHMGSDESKAVRVIHDAGKEASQQRIENWYGDPADRKKMFEVDSYRLAWGDKRVKPDAFLTGSLHTSADLKRASLTIEVFTAKAPEKLQKVTELGFETDIPLLRDLGKSFQLSKRSLKPGERSSGFVRRDVAIDEVKTNEVQPDESGAVTVDGIEFKLLSGDQAAAIKKSGAGGLEVACPEAAKPMVFSIRNTSDKKRGVDVKVNGKSLLFEQTDEAETCRLWVLEPGKTNLLKGWYLSEESLKNVAPFKVLVGDEARQMKEQLGQKAGDLDISVFETTAEASPGDGLAISRGLRGLPDRKAKEARRSYESYRRSLMHRSKQKSQTVTTTVNSKSLRREIVIADTDEEKRANQKLSAVEFPNRKPLGNISIKILPRQGPGDSSGTNDNEESKP
jgi:hypothetical protein